MIMKQLHLLALPALACAAALSSCSSIGITQSARLSYDMAHDVITTSPPGITSVNQGDMISLELTNINPFVYDVAINQKSVTYNTAIPPMFRMSVLGSDRLAESAGSALTLAENSGNENMAAISHFGDLYTDYRQKFMAFHAFVTFDEYLYNAIKRPFVDEQEFKEELKKRLTEAAGGTSLFSKSDFLVKAGALFGDISVAYYSMLAEYQKLEPNSKIRVKETFTRATALFTELSNSSAWTLKVGATADLFALIQSTPFRFFSFKSQAKGDAVVFTVEGHRKETTELRGLDDIRPFNLEYTVPVEGGWRIDGSAGLFVSNLVNESFSVKNENATQTILKMKGDVLTYGPGVMMHVYYRPIGLGLGLGMFMNNGANVQYLLGPSLMFGGNNRFTVNGGVTMGKVTRLADGLVAGEALVSQNPNLSAVPTVDRLEVGWFAGFSYNFTAGL